MKRLLILAALFVALLVGLSCGGSSGTNDSSPVAPAPQAGVLRIPGPQPQTLDPALSGDVGSAFYVNEIFGGLLTWVPESEAGDDKVCYDFSGKVYCMVPDIADSIPDPESHSDGTVSYTFTLRKDVKFHRGRQVTAHDFKYSLERALDPRLGSTTAELYLWDIIGAREYNRAQTDQTRGVKGIEVVDEFTLKLTVEKYNAVFLLKLTYPVSFVVDRNQAPPRQTAWWFLPNGTGPFRCSDCRTTRSEVVLEPNASYHLGAAKLARVEINFAGGSAPTQYADGDVDVSGVSLVEIEDVRSPGNPLSRELHESPEVSTTYIAFQTTQPPFDDVKVRQAIAMAIDKAFIVHQDLKDAVDVANTIVPPVMPGYDPPSDAALPYDPVKAKQLLAESSYAGNMPTVTILTSGRGGSPSDVIQRVEAMLEQNLGIVVEIETVGDFSVFLRRMAQGQYQMASFGWVADYPDPEDFLDLKFHGKRSVNNNETRYSNPKVDALLEEARGERDNQRRMKLYQEAERLILQDAPWVPLFHAKNIVLVKPYVTGYDPPPMGVPFLRYVEVK